MYLSQSSTNVSELLVCFRALLKLKFVHGPLHSLFWIQAIQKFLIFVFRNFSSSQGFKNPSPEPRQAGHRKDAQKNVYKKLFVRHDLFQGLVDRFIYLTSEPWKEVDMAMFEAPTSFERVVYVRT
jgi:hypothetical protein